MSRLGWGALGLGLGTIGCTWIPAKETVVVREVRDGDPTDEEPTGPTGPTGPTDPTTPTDPDPRPVELALTGLEPDYGSDAGGTRVVLSGRFDDDTEVTVDGARATVIDVAPDTLVVETPPGLSAGWVDVEVRSSGGRSASLPGAFQAWPDGAGRAGAVGWVDFLEPVGTYWADVLFDEASATIGFAPPNDWALWQSFAPALDECVYRRNGVPIELPAAHPTGATTITLRSATVSATVREEPTLPGLFSDALDAGTEVAPGTFDLDPVQGDADWPGFGAAGFVEVPLPFDVLDPDMTRATPADFTARDTIRWSGGGGDYVLIVISRMWDDGVDWHDDGYVTCAAVDDGSFTVTDEWPDWYADAFLNVQVGRVIEGGAVLPHDNSESRVAGVYWILGGAWTY